MPFPISSFIIILNRRADDFAGLLCFCNIGRYLEECSVREPLFKNLSFSLMCLLLSPCTFMFWLELLIL